jgi:hypothetical protein
MKDYEFANDELLTLEQMLKSKFSPIKPDQQFVGNLRSRLENMPKSQNYRQLAYIYLTTAGGLLIGLTIFLIGRKFFQETKGAPVI